MTEDKLSAPLDSFKEREIEIINLMAIGLSNNEIAEQLFITKETVRWYNKQIYSKLGTSRRTEAIALGREFGLIVDIEPASSETQTVSHKLPVTTGPFIGRDEELNELAQLLEKPEVRLLSIIAAGGMGKSRLSLELGHQIAKNYQHGAVFIDLTSIRDAEDILKFVVAELGLKMAGNQPAEEVLINYCREKQMLLIFDNFEHVLAGAEQLAKILEAAPNVDLIATSRERLNLRVETIFYLDPIDEFGDRLFLEMAEMMYPHFDPTEAERKEIPKIVELVGGLPLALIIAATWADTLSVSEIVEEIESNLDFLSAEMADMPERQRSIHAVIDPTWKRLSKADQKAFMWASVFRGGFTSETFKKVTGATARTLQSLLGRSLVNHGHGRRYIMHPLIRQYAREKLEAVDQVGVAKEAHLETFLAYAQTQAGRMFDGQHYLESLDAFEAEQDNFRAALDWSLQGNQVSSGVALILVIDEFWVVRSLRQEAVGYFEQAIEYQPDPALLGHFSSHLKATGQTEKAQENLEIAMARAAEENQQDILARAYRLTASHIIEEDSDKALQLLEQALAINQELALPQQIAHCYTVLSLYYKDAELDYPRALEFQEKALSIYEELGDLLGMSMAIYNGGLIYEHLGQHQQAKANFERSLALKQQIGDRAGTARRYVALANLAMGEENYEQAIEFINESRQIADDIGDLQRLAEVLRYEGLIHIIMGQEAEAQATLERGLQIAHRLKNNKTILETSSFLGLHYLVQGKSQEARPYVLEALQAQVKLGRPPWLSLLIYANLLWVEENFDVSIQLTVVLLNHKEVGEWQQVSNKYLLDPLIYRIQKKVGAAGWQKALAEGSDKTLEQAFEAVMTEIGL